GAQRRYRGGADRRRNGVEALRGRTWPALSEGGKLAVSKFDPSARVKDPGCHGLAGAEARAAEEALRQRTEIGTATFAADYRAACSKSDIKIGCECTG